jgi:hypothetical protein
MPASADAARHTPARFLLDANGDSHVTVGDALGWVQQAFFLPGDWTIWAINRYAPTLARFFEADEAGYGGLASGVIAACAWAVAFVAIGMCVAYVSELDRRATRAAAEWYGAARRRVQISLHRLRSRLRGNANARERDIELCTEVAIDAFELSVLRLHADLAPGYSLTARDVATALRKSTREMRTLLDSLKQRALLNRSLGGPEDETSYTISAAGRASLVLVQLAPRR